jgi:hypothetical protein
MYLGVIFVTMFVAPLLSIALDLWSGGSPLIELVGKWFVFWVVGVRLGLAGLRQVVQPRFTAEIFKINDEKAWPVVRELGIANLALAVVGLASLAKSTFLSPVAIIAAIFYGGAALQHIGARNRTTNETIAMASDLFAFVILGIYAIRAMIA